MNSYKYWSVIPTQIKKSRLISAEEKEVYYFIADNLNEAGYCTKTNAEFAKELNVSEKTITARLSNMQRKKAVTIKLNNHLHKRIIFLNLPQSPSRDMPNEPTEESLQPKSAQLIASLQKGIVFGTYDFNALIEKMLASPYLHEIKDNSRQFVLTMDQIDFLAEMKRLNKTLDCQIAIYPPCDYQGLVNAIRHSRFLMESTNLNLKFMLENAQAIIDGKYRDSTFLHKTETYTSKRNYTKQELNSFFYSLYEINF